MPEYHISGVIEEGGTDSKLLAISRASCVMFAPFFCGTAASESFMVLEG